MTTYELLTGNEAIARGVYESGVTVAAAYPGTPSTEILASLAQYTSVHSQWSPNEKVALEVAIGASIAGARAFAAMKHVGLNVAADPLMTFSYTGVGGGMVVVSADEPAMHSSQNEQDNRYFGMLGKIPVLEPSDSGEAKTFVKKAYALSEEFDTPVILRTTTRVNHSKSIVAIEEPEQTALRGYERKPEKYVMTPANAVRRHQVVEERRLALTAYAQTTELNRIERGVGEEGGIGFITAGISYHYVKDIFPDASYLKLGLTWPLNEDLIKGFAAGVKRVIVVEELEPVLETQIKAMGIACQGKDIIPRQGELSEELLRSVFAKAGLPVQEPETSAYVSDQTLPGRPPIFCPGCSHRGLFYVLKVMGLHVSGDIGCYALGSAPPFGCIDTTICMGASVGGAFGMELARGDDFANKCVAVIGDSTFYHSGITGLMNTVYNGGRSTILVLDNGTTAMTGHQDHPGTGKNIRGEAAPAADIAKLAESLGVRRVRVEDPFDLAACRAAIAEELAAPEVSVIIVRRPCALHIRLRNPAVAVDPHLCIGCTSCLKLGCPALSMDGDKAKVDPLVCVGCGLCPQVCPLKAITENAKEEAAAKQTAEENAGAADMAQGGDLPETKAATFGFGGAKAKSRDDGEVNVLIAGVGGQGTILAGKILSLAAIKSGFDVKQAEVHGMSQRGGSVVSHVRFGKRINSPLVMTAGADFILAFEELEALRYLPWLKTDGAIIANTQQLYPMPVITGLAQYPAQPLTEIAGKGAKLIAVDASGIGLTLGDARTANVVLLGVLSSVLPLPEAAWLAAIEESVRSSATELNRIAFRSGQDAVR